MHAWNALCVITEMLAVLKIEFESVHTFAVPLSMIEPLKHPGVRAIFAGDLHGHQEVSLHVLNPDIRTMIARLIMKFMILQANLITNLNRRI